MTKVTDIKKSISLILSEAFPDHKVYGTDTIEGYEKPCFFLDARSVIETATKNNIKRNVSIEIDYIQTRPNDVEALNFTDKLVKRLADTVRVEDRHLLASNIEFTMEGEFANIPVCTFDFVFWDCVKEDEVETLIEEVSINEEVTDG